MTSPVTGRGGSLDLDALAALEEERDFLLGSLDDLERERGAGDIDDTDYQTLKDDYTARAAAVLRAIDEGRAASAQERPTPSNRRRLLTALAVVAVAAVAGLLVMQSSGRRGSGVLTGLDVAAASSRVDDCQVLEQEGDPAAALDCYSEILQSLPGNVAALSFRGWLRVREGEIDDGLEDLDSAIRLDPEATAPRIFRASGQLRAGDAAAAVADLAAFYGNEPTEEERGLADRFAGRIVNAALDQCIAGEVAGDLAAVDALQCYRNVLDVDPRNPSASAYLGWLLARSGVTDEATALLDGALSAEPDLTAAYVFRAALRAHLGDTAGARADLDTFAGKDTPPDQQTAAAQVRAALDAGRDPLAR